MKILITAARNIQASNNWLSAEQKDNIKDLDPLSQEWSYVVEQYLNDIECDVNSKFGVETEPGEDFIGNLVMLIWYEDGDDTQMSMDSWREEEKMMALSSRSADEYAKKYTEFIKNLIV